MISLLLALSLAEAQPPDAAIVQGMTVSCPTWGYEWGTDEMVATLDELKALGVNWVTIHPYASISGDGTVNAHPLDPDEPPIWLTRPIAEAHARGMSVMIKPHLAYWGSPFSWRGDIDFEDAASRERFFTTYTRWITNVATITAAADAYVVGTELDKLVEHESDWRKVIASVRAVHPGHLTYAANWDGYQRVGFWDALDAIGVQAYFPLLPGSAPVTPDRLDTAWRAVMVHVHSLSERTGKPVVFTELGYPRAMGAAAEPWRPADSEVGEPTQLLALDAALRAVAAEPAVVGAFLWKWFPGSSVPRDYILQLPPQRELLMRRWNTEQP